MKIVTFLYTFELPGDKILKFLIVQ